MLGPHRVLEQWDRQAGGGSGSRTTGRLVIRVTVVAPRRQQQRAGEAGDGGRQLVLVVSDGRVGQLQPHHLGTPGDTERLECCRPLLGAQLGESGPRGRAGRPKGRLAVGDGKDPQPVPAQDDLSHQSADPEDLVVGVGRDDGQAAASVT